MKIERFYNTKVVSSGKRLEVYKYTCLIPEGRESNNKEGRRGKEEVTQDQKEKNSEQRRKETLNNARNNIVRLIKCNDDMNTFITLTYSVDRDIKDSRKDLDKFFKRLKYKQNNFKYLWVMEYTKKGRIHFHILTNFQTDITSIGKEKKSEQHKNIENEFSKKYWKNGFIDIRKLDQEGNTNIALYVATYLTKDVMLLNLQGYRVYGCSRNLNRPITTKIISSQKTDSLISLEGYKLNFVNAYKVYYRNRKNEEVIGNVNYFDYQQE